MANAMNLFNMLLKGVRDATKNAPTDSGLIMGFTKTQWLKKQLADPRLIWFDKTSETYYDQGSAKKIGNKNFGKYTAENIKKDKPMRNLQYYIPIGKDVLAESSKLSAKDIH